VLVRLEHRGPQNPYGVQDAEMPHLRSESRTLAHRLDTLLLLELIRWDVIEVFTPDMGHEIAHRRASFANEFIRDVPHFAECAVDRLGGRSGPMNRMPWSIVSRTA
jgi:hypothetical protein